MSKNIYVRIYRFVFGLVILISIAVQFFTFRQTPINFFSYFTVISNLLASFSLISLSLKRPEQKYLNILRGAATLYVIITGLGFTILLGGKNEEFIWWINIIVHYITPIIMLLDWIFILASKITFRKSLIWIGFMLVYLIYSLIRGSVTNWYPYSFLDKNIVGLNGIVNYSLILLSGTLLITWVLIRIANKD
jgi:hypothetical protein